MKPNKTRYADGNGILLKEYEILKEKRIRVTGSKVKNERDRESGSIVKQI